MPYIEDQIQIKCKTCDCNTLICKGIIFVDDGFIKGKDDFNEKINQCFKGKIHNPEFNMNFIFTDILENSDFKRDAFCLFSIDVKFLNEFESIKRFIFNEINKLLINEHFDTNLVKSTGPILWLSNSKQEFIQTNI